MVTVPVCQITTDLYIVVVRYVAQRMELISIGIWDDTLIIHTLNRQFNCISIFDRIDYFFTDFDDIKKNPFCHEIS